jgi:glycosyltransferase involved in cell wall biosynthesis
VAQACTTMTQMLVSVVIPLYNKVRHIERAVDSVLAQTCSDFELIVVDDGSTDGGGNIVRRYTDPRVRLITQQNAGVSAARNRGASEATSDLVAFLDADDQWLPDFLETVLRLRDRFRQASVWATAYSTVGHEEQVQPEFPGAAVAGPEGGLIDYFQSPGPWMPVHASAVMVRKDALVRAGGFPIDMRCGEDWDTWIRLALRYPIAWSPQAKMVFHYDAENRTEGYCNTGATPYVLRVREFLQEVGPGSRVAEHVYRHVAWCHMRLLSGNWLAGDRQAMKTILEDCRGIKSVRMRCLLWQCLRCMPHRVVVAMWKLRQRLAGRPTKLPPFRNIRRPLPDGQRQS